MSHRGRMLVVCSVAVVSVLICTNSFADPNIISEPVGFVKISIDPGQQQLVSIPFHAFDTAINEVLKGQLTGGDKEAAADSVLKWNSSEAGYDVAIKADATGDAAKDGKWFKSVGTWEPSEMEIVLGEGFFIHNKQSTTQTVFLCGTVVLDKNIKVDLPPGVTLFSYPFPSTIPIKETTLKEAMGADDNISDGNTGMLSDEDALLLGEGYWFQRKEESHLEWHEKRPYADLYPVNGKPPLISAMVLGENMDLVTLSIACTGDESETLDIFYQDLTDEHGLVSRGAWHLATRDMDVNGHESIAWTDVGSSSRPQVGEVLARCYLVGRADIDNDGDGVPDAREIFAHGTDPNDAESSISGNATSQTGSGSTTSGQSKTARKRKGRVVHVSTKVGKDSYDGRSAIVVGNRGPKKTVRAGLAVVERGDLLKIYAGVYENEGSISFCGKGIDVMFSGDVKLP